MQNIEALHSPIDPDPNFVIHSALQSLGKQSDLGLNTNWPTWHILASTTMGLLPIIMIEYNLIRI